MDKQCKIEKKNTGVTYLKFTMNFQTDLCASRIVDVLEQTLSLVSATILDKTISYLQNINLKLI